MTELNEDETETARSVLEESVETLHRGSFVSILLMVASMIVLIATTFHSMARLRELDREVAERQDELQQMERAALALAGEKAVLERAVARARQQGVEAPNQPATPTDDDEPAEGVGESIAADEIDDNVPIATLRGIESSRDSEPATLEMAIASLFSEDAVSRVRAYESLMAYHSGDGQLVPRLVAYARQYPGSSDGIYNTLVVLNNLHPAALEPHGAALRTFASEIRESGPRIRDLASVLLLRLPPEVNPTR